MSEVEHQVAREIKNTRDKKAETAEVFMLSAVVCYNFKNMVS